MAEIFLEFNRNMFFWVEIVSHFEDSILLKRKQDLAF